MLESHHSGSSSSVKWSHGTENGSPTDVFKSYVIVLLVDDVNASDNEKRPAEEPVGLLFLFFFFFFFLLTVSRKVLVP